MTEQQSIARPALDKLVEIEEVFARLDGGTFLFRKIVDDLDGCDERLALEHLSITQNELIYKMSDLLEELHSALEG